MHNELVYLDTASSDAVNPHIIKAMLPFWLDNYANPSSVHSLGKTAAGSLDCARQSIAADLGAAGDDVIITSGGTESDNLAVKGIAMGMRLRQRERNHIAMCAIEHPAVSKSAQWLARHLGFYVDIIPVDGHARIDLEAARDLISDRTAVVSVSLANNEVGTIQPIRAIADIAHEHGAMMHTDAVQAAGLIPVNMQALGVDALSLSAHKFGAPKGVGALIMPSTVAFEALISGGGQEHDRRSGTQNVAGAVAMALALHDAIDDMNSRGNRLARSRNRLIEAVLTAIPQARLTGESDCLRRLPGHASFICPHVWSEALLVDLDAAGIICSSGSACSDRGGVTPQTLLAMGLDEHLAATSIRMTFRTPLDHDTIDRIAHSLSSSYRALCPPAGSNS